MVPLYGHMIENGGPELTTDEQTGLNYLRALGKEAKSQAPSLITRYHKVQIHHKESIINALIAIETDRKDVVPIVENYLALAKQPGGYVDPRAYNIYNAYLKNSGEGLARPWLRK